MSPVETNNEGVSSSSRQRLLDSALACVDDNGPAATTIDMIRRRANASIGSLYHHFGNKDGLLAALYFQLMGDQLAWSETDLAAAQTLRDLIDALVHGYLEWVTQNPREARFLYAVRSEVAAGPQAERLARKNKQRFARLQILLRAGVEAGTVRALPRDVYASLLVGQSENYCRAWLSGRVRTEPSSHGPVFADAAWRAIAV